MQEPDACLEDGEDIDASNLLEIEKSLLMIGGKVHCGNSFVVVNDDLYSTKISAQQIHMLEMRVDIRRVHLGSLAIDMNAKQGWN
jgi:hypothetical protein